MKQTITLEVLAKKPFLELEMIAVYQKTGKLIAISAIREGNPKNRLSLVEEPLFASLIVNTGENKLPIELPVYHLVINGDLATPPPGKGSKLFKSINSLQQQHVFRLLEGAQCLDVYTGDDAEKSKNLDMSKF